MYLQLFKKKKRKKQKRKIRAERKEGEEKKKKKKVIVLYNICGENILFKGGRIHKSSCTFD